MVFELVVWGNFALFVSVFVKFLPLAVSYFHGIKFTPEEIEAGLLEKRLWALDLVSDTFYVMVVWFLVSCFIQKNLGEARIFPWRRKRIGIDECPRE